MASDVTYSSYLDLDRVLAAQHPVSGAHDEMLFIVVHQASELWLKLCLHELSAARALIAADDLSPAFKMLARVARHRDRADHGVEGDVAGHAPQLPFRQPGVLRFPDDVGTQRGGDEIAQHRHQSDD